MHIGCEPDAQNEDEMSRDVVADVLVVNDIVDVHFDVEDVVDKLLDEDVHDVDLDDFAHAVGHYQSGMYLTLIATHKGVGFVDQDNEVVEVDAVQHVEDEMDVIKLPEDELLKIIFVEDGFLMVDVAEGNSDSKDVRVDILMQE